MIEPAAESTLWQETPSLGCSVLDVTRKASPKRTISS
jgi:hypothetical protein